MGELFNQQLGYFYTSVNFKTFKNKTNADKISKENVSKLVKMLMKHLLIGFQIHTEFT